MLWFLLTMFKFTNFLFWFNPSPYLNHKVVCFMWVKRALNLKTFNCMAIWVSPVGLHEREHRHDKKSIQYSTFIINIIIIPD